MSAGEAEDAAELVDDLAELDDIPPGDDQPGQDPPTDEPTEG